MPPDPALSGLEPPNAAADYAALQPGPGVGAGVVWFDRSARVRTRFSGPKAADVLTGLVTNDVKALRAGHGQYAAALTPKSKIVADCRVFAFEESLLVDVSARAGAGWRDVVRKYVNPRLAAYRDETTVLADVAVFGPRAAEVLAVVTGIGGDVLQGLEPYHHASLDSASRVLTVARVPDLGAAIDGFDVFVPAEARDALVAQLAAGGAIAGSHTTWEIARVEAGRPEWGVDMDDSTIPQEANLDELGAISYTKGCYTGQETVARIHFRGHVNRHLRGLHFATDVLPALRTPLVTEDGTPVGDTRSTVHSPRLGPIGIAMLRREIATGATVIARSAGADDVAATVR